jgi:hypothetical protein
MITNIRLLNFKKYANQSIDLSPRITLLVGPNSSGKSSIIKSLLAFKQTFEDQGDHTGFLSRGPYVDIGPFIEYVRNHNEKATSTFVFHVRPTLPMRSNIKLFVVEVRYVHEMDPQTGHGRLREYQLTFHGDVPPANDTAAASRGHPLPIVALLKDAEVRRVLQASNKWRYRLFLDALQRSEPRRKNSDKS